MKNMIIINGTKYELVPGDCEDCDIRDKCYDGDDFVQMGCITDIFQTIANRKEVTILKRVHDEDRPN